MKFFNAVKDIAPDIMLEVEAKDKNISAVKRPNCAMPDKKRLQKDRARHKYSVMEKSKAHCRAISHLFHKKNYPAVEFYETAEEAYALGRSAGNEKNAAMHIWGDNSRTAPTKGICKTQVLLENLENGGGALRKLKRHLGLIE